MFNFDKLALLLISLICLGCAVYLSGADHPTAGQATLLGGLVAFLAGAQAIFFAILKSEAKVTPPPAAPSEPPAEPSVPPAA